LFLSPGLSNGLLAQIELHPNSCQYPSTNYLDHGKGNSDDEQEDDNEIFFHELKMAQWTLCKKLHIDSEVEIDIAHPRGTALKAVLIKKKGFESALLPPLVSVDHSA
jgi:hypothetical protein